MGFYITDWADFSHRSSNSSTEVVESALGTTEAAMDTGNPWDSKPLAASTTADNFDNPFGGSASPEAAEAEGWANFSSAKDTEGDSEMSPVKTTSPTQETAEAGEERQKEAVIEAKPEATPAEET